MFIHFFSDDVYEQQWWPSVFAIENMIQATVREDWRELTGMANDELTATLRDRIEGFGAENRGSHLPLDKSFVNEFLHREVPSIVLLLADLQSENNQYEIATLDPRFALNEQRLRECMKISLEFRDFVRVPPSAA